MRPRHTTPGRLYRVLFTALFSAALLAGSLPVFGMMLAVSSPAAASLPAGQFNAIGPLGDQAIRQVAASHEHLTPRLKPAVQPSPSDQASLQYATPTPTQAPSPQPTATTPPPSPAPSPSTQTPAPQPTSSGQTFFTYGQLESLWVSVGGPSWTQAAAASVAECESGGNANAYNPSGASGLWQILGQVVAGDIFNPTVNAQNAVSKFEASGDTWAQWVCQP